MEEEQRRIGEVSIEITDIVDGGQSSLGVAEEAAPPWPWVHKFKCMVLKLVTIFSETVPDNHPVFDTVRTQELGKLKISLAVSLIAILFSAYHFTDKEKIPPFAQLTALFVELGLVLIFSAQFLRGSFDRVSNLMELIGILLVSAAIIFFQGLIFPGVFAVLIPVFCFIWTLLVFLIAFCSRGTAQRATETQTAEDLVEIVILQN